MGERMKILGYRYRIIRKHNIDDLGAMGTFRAKPQKISIASDLTQQQVESTMLHEIIEALNYHLALGLEHPVIMRLEAALYQCLVDNGVDLAPLSVSIETEHHAEPAD